MNKKTKVVASGLAIGASYIVIINKIVDEYFKRSKIGVDSISFIKDEKIKAEATRLRPVYHEWFQDSNKEELYVSSYDGLKLHGFIINNLNTDNYIIICHGLNGSYESSLDLAYNFEKFGYNSLIFDQRASGESEGDYNSMGSKESLDLQKWILTLIDKHKDAKIILHGTSMGAAAVCLALGCKLPENVKCAISDCGFTSLENEMKFYIKSRYHLIAKPILVSIEARLKDKLSFCYSDVMPINALKSNTIPICFVHGEEDKLVPFKMANELFNSNTNGIRKYFPVKGKNHAQSKYDPDYYITLDKFIKENL